MTGKSICDCIKGPLRVDRWTERSKTGQTPFLSISCYWIPSWGYTCVRGYARTNMCDPVTHYIHRWLREFMTKIMRPCCFNLSQTKGELLYFGILSFILYYFIFFQKICRYIKKHKFFDIHEFFKNFY